MVSLRRELLTSVSAFPNVNDFVSRRLVSRCAETRRLRELPH